MYLIKCYHRLFQSRPLIRPLTSLNSLQRLYIAQKIKATLLHLILEALCAGIQVHLSSLLYLLLFPLTTYPIPTWEMAHSPLKSSQHFPATLHVNHILHPHFLQHIHLQCPICVLKANLEYHNREQVLKTNVISLISDSQDYWNHSSSKYLVSIYYVQSCII